MPDKIAILCPGPSLARLTADKLNHQIIICVNRAILKVFDPEQEIYRGNRHLRWAILDRPLYDEMSRQHPMLSSVKMLTLPSRFREWDLIDAECPNLYGVEQLDGKGLFTFTFALASAHDMLSTGGTIDVFGCEMTTEPDFDGQSPPGCNRSDDRWEREKQQIQPYLRGNVVFHK